MKEEEIKKRVRERYAGAARQGKSCCASASSCCGGASLTQDVSKAMGYTEEELKAIPEGAELGLGCGNPVALASLKQGETVLDLGSGAGVDCFLAANRVGEHGMVIGVDMTSEMVERARENARKGSYPNVEFRLGEIENLPAADSSVDVVISNCVINLSTDKERVFREAFRVLKPGGRLMVSDLVLLRELPDFIRNSIEAYTHCIAGAWLKDDYIGAIRDVGFNEVRVMDESAYPLEYLVTDPMVKAFIENSGVSPEEVEQISGSVVSVKVCGIKPK